LAHLSQASIPASSAAEFAKLPFDAFELAPDEARERFRSAAARGTPHWLWPEVSPRDWSQALERIAAVARDVLAHGRSSQPLDGDPAALGIAGFTSGMGPLLGYWAESGAIACTGDVAAMLELHLRHNRLRMKRIAERAEMLSLALSAGGVAHTFLKGMHTAFSYFPEPGARPLADIDVLIDPADASLAAEAMVAADFSAGFTHTWPPEQSWHSQGSPAQPRSLHVVHADDPWPIDLHTSLNRRYAAGSPIIRLDEAVPVGLSRGPACWPGAQWLSQPLLLLHLAVHASCGLESLSLVRLVELVLVIRRDMTDAGWDAFLAAAERAGALASAYPALRLCDQLVPGTVPAAVLGDARREVPPAVRRVVDLLTPATGQRVLRCSLAERFMWARSRRAIVRQVLNEVFPPGSGSIRTLLEIYRARVWRIARGTLAR
jgi:hypothetical protein